MIVSLLFPYLITLKSTPHSLEAVPGAGPRPGEEQSCPTCDISEGEADGEVPRGIWGRKTWACCRERSGMETDQHPRRETRKGGGVLHSPSPPQLPGLRPMEEQAGLLPTHTHPAALRDSGTPPHSQETLCWIVLSMVT